MSSDFYAGLSQAVAALVAEAGPNAPSGSPTAAPSTQAADAALASWKASLAGARHIVARYPRAWASVLNALGPGFWDRLPQPWPVDRMKAGEEALAVIFNSLRRLCADGDRAVSIAPTTGQSTDEDAVRRAVGGLDARETTAPQRSLQSGVDAMRLLFAPPPKKPKLSWEK